MARPAWSAGSGRQSHAGRQGPRRLFIAAVRAAQEGNRAQGTLTFEYPPKVIHTASVHVSWSQMARPTPASELRVVLGCKLGCSDYTFIFLSVSTFLAFCSMTNLQNIYKKVLSL